jgi:hypothetical protein
MLMKLLSKMLAKPHIKQVKITIPVSQLFKETKTADVAIAMAARVKFKPAINSATSTALATRRNSESVKTTPVNSEAANVALVIGDVTN